MTIIIYNSDKYNLINLDVFNIDISAIDRQLVFFSFSNSSQATSTFLLSANIVVALGGFSAHIKSESYHWQKPKVVGYYSIFGFYPIIPLFCKFCNPT